MSPSVVIVLVLRLGWCPLIGAANIRDQLRNEILAVCLGIENATMGEMTLGVLIRKSASEEELRPTDSREVSCFTVSPKCGTLVQVNT